MPRAVIADSGNMMRLNRPPALYRLRVKTPTEGLYGLFRKRKSPYEARFFLYGFFL
jgi:hypothetical protein